MEGMLPGQVGRWPAPPGGIGRPLRRYGALAGLPLTVLLTACGPGEGAASVAEPGSTLSESAGSAAGPTVAVRDVGYDPAGYDPDPGQGFVPLDDPTFLPVGQASHLEADEFVLGVEWNGEARAYPVAMMAYHHIANDSLRGSPLLVTY
jgi:hypothetical protein